jgi:glucans biosynthesis protein
VGTPVAQEVDNGWVYLGVFVFPQQPLQIAAVLALFLISSTAGAAPSAPKVARPPFTFATVQRLAQDRATHPYRNRSPSLPQNLSKLTYDQYRDIRFRPASALWADQALFEAQFFHRGFNYDRRVNIYEVGPDGVRSITYSPTMFEFGPAVPALSTLPADLGFAGFRIHYPLNNPGYKDEVIVFLGASYFRVLGRNQVYGMSARGLAVNTATAGGEEFPYFTDFWLVRPDPKQRTLTIYALLDSPSVTGAYHFELRPGTTTQVEVSAELYPRRAVEKLGIAPLTSMYLHGENGTFGRRFDDFRPEVHDSDGLMMQTGGGEWLWRPLVNPKELRVNRFMDQRPHGFALAQRDRAFDHYQDNGARFELRPSYWIEPLGDWGKGGVELVEIPSDEEIHDNIVAYWVPDAPVEPNKPISFSYLLSSYMRTSAWPPGGRVIDTRFGSAANPGAAVTNATPQGLRRVVVDFAGGDLDSLGAGQPVQAEITASNGQVDEVSVEHLPEAGVWRASMRLKPGGDKLVELRCYLTLYGEALTETWTYLLNPSQ